MEIGDKIKKLRTDKLMSQGELAGGEITRNMLSCIEHGSALPSLGTLRYIASRLNVSPGFLLAEGSDEEMYLKNSRINDIKKAYTAKNFELCYDMCKKCAWNDDEITMILAECSLMVGIERFNGGELRRAADYFDEAVECCNRTIYNTDVIYSRAQAYFRYMEMVSPTIQANALDYCEPNRLLLFGDGFSVYSDIMYDASVRSWFEMPFLLERIDRLEAGSVYALHVSAKIMMEKGKYAEAYDVLHKLLFTDSYKIAEPIMYFVFCDLEICCKETEDFKGAYEYSNSKVALMQKMLG